MAVLSVSLIASAAQAADLDDAEDYLNAITTLRADFQQIAPDGSFAKGELSLKRPGKMRWDYAPPTPILMVSDGDTLIYVDEEMDEVTYLDIDDTLAAIIAKAEIDFDDDALKVSDVSSEEGMLRITLRREEDRDDGALTLVFRTDPMALYQLQVLGADEGVTLITLENIQKGVTLDDALFTFRRSRLPKK